METSLALLLLIISNPIKILEVNETILNYYTNLIDLEIEKSYQYQLPSDNSEFFDNSGNHFKPLKSDNVYDFVIVGAGTSGSILANSLSENPNWKVLVIEAGGEEIDFSVIPAMRPFMEYSKMDWGYYTTPQKHMCQATPSKACFYPRGKGIGGTTTINDPIYARGFRQDYDSWSKFNSYGWSYVDVLPYFKKQENAVFKTDNVYHGNEGPLDVTYSIPSSKYWDVFGSGCKELGFNETDYNGEQIVGYSKVQLNTRKGKALTAGKAFLEPVLHRPNIEIFRKSLVTRLVIENGKATGVEFFKGGKQYTATSKKEVVLTCGIIATPQLLLLSGIGPKEDLEKLNIPLVKDLPDVGKNFRNQINFVGLGFSTNLSFDQSKEQAVAMFADGIGPLTRPPTEAVAFVHTNQYSEQKIPDVSLAMQPPNPYSLVKIYENEMNNDEASKYLAKLDPKSTLRIEVALLKPKSVGNVTLFSKNPILYPLIDPNYLSETADIENLYQGIQIAMKLSETKSFKNINATFINPRLSACTEYKEMSKDFWYCQIRHLTVSNYGASGTAAMGKVVNSRLQVLGVGGVRIVDISVAPELVSASWSTHGFMIGQRGADFIKEDYDRLALLEGNAGNKKSFDFYLVLVSCVCVVINYITCL